MSIVKREGYGNAFNTVYVKDGRLYKCAKNDYGKEKLRKELAFYKECKEKGIPFPLAEEVEGNSGVISMKFYENYIPFYKIFWQTSLGEKEFFRIRIQEFLDKLHQASKKEVSFNVIQRDIYEETVVKIVSRYEEVRSCIGIFEVESVNSLHLLSFDFLMEYIQKRIQEFLLNTPQEYSLIHGDCQFSNLLYEKESDSFVFIDPRGYFGKTEVYGLPQYDSAKLLFALSGYDIFDSLPINTLNIENKNINTDFIPLDTTIFQKITLDLLLMVSIWLGNAHCFKENPVKAALSHYYARYIGTLVYISDTSLIK